ncbi:MAG: type I secretion system permease/ATPase [Desulfarculales bacterium]|jgi:ATP-binding cassette subfamily C protein LapB|nr:type I secretion system permease/ATPase [Desulfarculales bacterium]
MANAPNPGMKEDVAAVPPGMVDYTPPLLTCLSMLMGLMGQPRSVASLMSNLPQGDKAFTPMGVLRAAHRAGARAKVVSRSRLKDISSLVMPVILLLKNNNACILTKLENEQAQVIFPELGQEPQPMRADELSKEYIGQAIFLQLEPKLDQRAFFHERFSARSWFWNTLWHFRPIYMHVILASVVVNMLALASPLFTMNVYDRVVPNNAIPTLWVMFSGVIIAFLFDFLLKNLRSYFVDMAGRNADTIIASRIMQQLMSLRMDNLPPSTGGLANNIREFEQLRDFFGSTTLLALVDIPFLAVFLMVVYFISGPLVIVPAIAVPVVILAGIFLQKPMKANVEQGQRENMQKNALLVEAISGLDTIKTNQAEGLMQRRWEEVVAMNAESTAKGKALVTLTTSLTMSATQIVTVVCVAWGVYLIYDNQLTTGALIATSILLGRVMAPLSSVANMLSRLQKSKTALNVLDQIMTLPTERPQGKGYLKMDYIDNNIAFENVGFSYPGAAHPAVQGVSFAVKPGEKVGIVGRIGSGKTTMGRLAMGLYLPSEGQIKLGGIDIQQLDIADLRRKIGYVSQDNFLFFGSVRDNITFGFPQADDQLIMRAAYLAGVTEFVRNHEAGFDMPVGERGMALSGGQRQSVSIARALLPDPDIYILDEPTSGMDVASEAIFFKRLQESSDNKTMLLITHRYSLLALVERIIVMDRGRIVADGPREQILRQAMGGAAPAPPPPVKSPSPPHLYPPKPPKARSQAHRLGPNAITFSDEAR